MAQDPDKYCIKCGAEYRFADDFCSLCGFAPVDDLDDGQAQEDALEAYRLHGGKEED